MCYTNRIWKFISVKSQIENRIKIIKKPNWNHQFIPDTSNESCNRVKTIHLCLKTTCGKNKRKKKCSWEWKNVLVFIDVRNHIEIIKNETKKKVRKKDKIYDGCRIINFVFFTCVVCECLWFVVILQRKYIFSPTRFNQKKKIGAVHLKFCVYNRSPDKF